MIELLGISYSPWTQQAKWALQHHQVPFAYREYSPGLGALGLRWRLRRRQGLVSVPVLFADGAAIESSWDIARWAEQHGKGTQLFSQLAATQLWKDRCDAALRYGRNRVIASLIESEAALDEASRGMVPAAMTGAVRPVARAIAKNTMAKYQPAPAREALTEALDAMDAALRAPEGYLLGEFSYADMAAVAMLEMVDPVADAFVKRGPASRALWRDEALAAKHGRLLSWRDGVCLRHRLPRKPPPAPSAA